MGVGVLNGKAGVRVGSTGLGVLVPELVDTTVRTAVGVLEGDAGMHPPRIIKLIKTTMYFLIFSFSVYHKILIFTCVFCQILCFESTINH